MSIFGVSRDIGVSRDTTKVIHSREYFIYKISTRYLQDIYISTNIYKFF